MPSRKRVEDGVLVESYDRLGNVWKVGAEVGLCGQSVHERLSRLGVLNRTKWRPDEDARLIELYSSQESQLFLDEVAGAMGRSRASVACRANQLGITSYSRPKDDSSREKNSACALEWHRVNEHPRGMLGKSHTPEVREILRIANKLRMDNMTREELDARAEKSLETKKKNGTVNSMRDVSNPYSRTKSGKRSDIGGTFFRSRVEANYARYLNHIGISWEYEPRDFYFDGIKRGCVSYTPDFYITEEDRWVEVKGWLDARGKTKLRRFKKYFPEEAAKMTIITQSKKTNIAIAEMGYECQKYEDIDREYKGIIQGWE